MKTMDQKIVDTIRVLSAEGVQTANSGHPGLPMGAAPMAYTLWSKVMKHHPKNPGWVDRDRFILSAGHGSMLIYSLLHLFGYGLKIEDLKDFRQLDSLTPGHPEYGHTVGVEATTGPLGAGFATAVGMAMAEANLAANYNREGYEVINHMTYTLVGDGCLMEGITSEAASLAGTLKLGKLITLYDSNRITIEGSTDIAFTEDVATRYRAYGWQVLEVPDGNDLESIENCLNQAKDEKNKPSLIIVHTTIGYGCPAKEGKASAHGEPLGQDNLLETKKNLGFSTDQSFYVEEGIYDYLKEQVEGKRAEQTWQTLFEEYRLAYPELADELEKRWRAEVDLTKLDESAYWQFENKKIATRALSGEVIQRLTAIVPHLFGGAADLAPSTKTYMKDCGDFSAIDYQGMNLHFGVRELAMTAMLNGIALHGGFKAFGATFFVFSDYMKPMIRLAALMKLPVTYVLTHDSIGVGEDGPTHQPIEQLASLRSIPGVTVFRPADGKEVAAAWYYAMHSQERPTAIVLTRQNVPYYEATGKEALKGGYILRPSAKETPDVLLMASGSEVELIFEAAKSLALDGIEAQVVSMPAFDLFDSQSPDYREQVLPSRVTARFAVEAASDFGWYRYLGLDGQMLAINHFGESAPGAQLFEKYGFTVEHVVSRVKEMLK